MSSLNSIKSKVCMFGAVCCICSVLFSIEAIKVEAATSTTFPVDEAGISAYVKLDSVDITDLTEALNFYHEIKEQSETYVIGTVNVVNQTNVHSTWSNFPHVYIGLDGWMVAYYLKTEEASQIMQWNGYTAPTITTTTLQDAIDIMRNNIGTSYPSPEYPKYYDFEFPDANRLTLVAETVCYDAPHGETLTNSFSVTIPGVLYEASYMLQMFSSYDYEYVELLVDGVRVFYDYKLGTKKNILHHDYYDPSVTLAPEIPHYITLRSNSGFCAYAANVLIYKVE